MTTFSTESYQIEEGNKWIPDGTIWEANGSNLTLKRITFHDKPCDTEDEANQIITNYCLERGYVAGNIERK